MGTLVDLKKEEFIGQGFSKKEALNQGARVVPTNEHLSWV